MADRRLLLGLGLDESDGHTRITRADQALLLGGSEETHERMQEHVIHLNEELNRRGKGMDECSTEELTDIIREVVDRC